jgi:TonB family protein
MLRTRLFAAAIALLVNIAQPNALLSQENQNNSAKETYEGDALCQSRRGVYPRRVYTPDPEYDDKARKKKIQGTVVLSTIVTKEGATADIRLMRTLTPGLDQQAIKAVSRWKFEPVVQDGKACPMKINVEVQFRLY